MKILVCEDDPVMMLVLTSMLRKLQYEVISSHDGPEALSLIESELPDMVITDMMLPNISGAEIISYIKDFTRKKIPVILLSSMPAQAFKNNDNYFGADGYLMKPAFPDELKSTIEKLRPAGSKERCVCSI